MTALQGVNKPFFSPAGEEEVEMQNCDTEIKLCDTLQVRVQEGATAFLPCQVLVMNIATAASLGLASSHWRDEGDNR